MEKINKKFFRVERKEELSEAGPNDYWADETIIFYELYFKNKLIKISHSQYEIYAEINRMIYSKKFHTLVNRQKLLVKKIELLKKQERKLRNSIEKLESSPQKTLPKEVLELLAEIL